MPRWTTGLPRPTSAWFTDDVPALGDSTKGQARRAAIIQIAVRRFARRGLWGTSTQEIAEEAGISQPYIYRLFTNKIALFIAALDHVSDVLAAATTEAFEHPSHPDDPVATMLSSYADVLTDDDVLGFLLQANCAADEPHVAEALRRCWAKQVETLQAASGASPEDVRRILGAEMLANAVHGLGLSSIDETWAKVLTGRS